MAEQQLTDPSQFLERTCIYLGLLTAMKMGI